MKAYITVKTQENDNSAEDDNGMGDVSGDATMTNSLSNGALINRFAALLGLSDTTITSLLANNVLVAIDPPTTGIDSNEAEEEIFPLSSEDVKHKTMQTLLSGGSTARDNPKSRRSVNTSRSKIKKSKG